jgi:hypothetical protein
VVLQVRFGTRAVEPEQPSEKLVDVTLKVPGAIPEKILRHDCGSHVSLVGDQLHQHGVNNLKREGDRQGRTA